MNDRFAALSWSVPCGRWFATQVRVSVFFVAVPLILMVRLGPTMGGAITVALFVATVLHEFGHVFACRLKGGGADEILIWPLGGLATLHYPRSTAGRLWTIAAGPFVNLVGCVATWPHFYAPQQDLRSLMIPTELPHLEFTAASWSIDARLVFFAVNWLMLVINLIPALPLDGGQMLRTAWQAQSGSETAFRGVTMTGMASGWIAMAIGLMVNWPWAVALGAILLIINMASWNHRGMDESGDDSFFGYDFSQGYTSLERNADESKRAPSVSWWQLWQQRRRQQRTEREQARLIDLEQQLDVLLAKVHESGLESLTPYERRRLREASEALRDRTKKTS